MEALQRINKHFGITVICNLHSLELARLYCDRLVGMGAGRIVFDGVPATLSDDAARAIFDVAPDGPGSADPALLPGAPLPAPAMGRVAARRPLRPIAAPRLREPGTKENGTCSTVATY